MKLQAKINQPLKACCLFSLHAASPMALQHAQAAHHLRHGWPLQGRLRPALPHQVAIGFQALGRSGVGARQCLPWRQLQALTMHNLGTNLHRKCGKVGCLMTREA